MILSRSLNIDITIALLLSVFLFIGALSTHAAAATDPYAKADNTWITINGQVEKVAMNSFVLDYGEGVITVEMDDGDRDADAYMLMPDDKVTVRGKIDDDFFEIATIEASSVHVDKLDTTFYASPRDETATLSSMVMPASPTVVTLTGTVTKVGTEDFTLDTGLRSLTVDTEGLAYNPLDDEGFIKIGVGDVVEVSGNFDKDFFEKRKFQAEAINKLVE